MNVDREAQRRFEALRETGRIGGVSDAVLEDAQRQLAGMLAGLAELVDVVPLVGDPGPLAAGGSGQAGHRGDTGPQGGGANPPLPMGEAARRAGEGGAGLVTNGGSEGKGGPHPSPLPLGEGTRSPHPSPLPGGEGKKRASDLCALSVAELAARIRRREVSPVEATRAVLDRIESHDGSLHTFITVTAEQALEDARRAEREIAAGSYRGPLHGVPVAAKDLYQTAGVRTTCGSAILRDWVPNEDAASIATWREAGAVLIGKNTLHEFAFGGTSVNEHTGTPRNPWNPERICGGSSGGSAAAVAAGFAYGAFGSETGNSIRRPASFCGVVGLKPTFGRVSRRGVFPLAWTLDHVGVFARTAADAALLTAPLCGFDPSDPGSRRPPPAQADPAAALAPVAGLRGRCAGVPRALLTGLDPEVERAFEAVLDGLRAHGVEVVDVELPFGGRWTALASSITMHAEAAAVHARWLDEQPRDYGADVLARLFAGRALGAAEYARAQTIRGAVTAELIDALRAVDVLIAPGTPAPAPPVQAGAYVPGDAPWGTEPVAFQLQRLFSLTGVPAAIAPCGLSADGLPLAIQLGGRPWEEGLLLGFVAAIMDSVPDSRRAPAIAPLG
ncbi:MAG: amidase [Chloroflexi bacterium]|nr:amidase [Chloroflexota bacterium]